MQHPHTSNERKPRSIRFSHHTWSSKSHDRDSIEERGVWSHHQHGCFSRVRWGVLPAQDLDAVEAGSHDHQVGEREDGRAELAGGNIRQRIILITDDVINFLLYIRQMMTFKTISTY